MEIVISKSYEYFRSLMNKVGAEWTYDKCFEIRTSPILIDYVKRGHTNELKVVTIPTQATDYEILEYDGREFLIYVLAGKLRYAE